MSEPTWIPEGQRERWQDVADEFARDGATSELTAVLFPEISQTVEEADEDV